jgi:hypothetical protein
MWTYFPGEIGLQWFLLLWNTSSHVLLLWIVCVIVVGWLGGWGILVRILRFLWPMLCFLCFLGLLWVVQFLCLGPLGLLLFLLRLCFVLVWFDVWNLQCMVWGSMMRQSHLWHVMFLLYMRLSWLVRLFGGAHCFASLIGFVWVSHFVRQMTHHVDTDVECWMVWSENVFAGKRGHLLVQGSCKSGSFRLIIFRSMS